MDSAESLRLPLDDGASVSALLQSSAHPKALLVLAHGAGAGMNHSFLAAIADSFLEEEIATLRFQFPYMEKGSRRPDPPKVAHAAVRAAVAEAARQRPNVPLFAGGKSFGARMTSQAQAVEALPHVQGLVFFGFPLHPPGKPSMDRAKHLADVALPMLFLQGTRDEFAELALLQNVCRGLSDRVTLKLFEQADHSFHAPVKSGYRDADIRAGLVGTATEWMGSISRQSP